MKIELEGYLFLWENFGDAPTIEIVDKLEKGTDIWQLHTEIYNQLESVELAFEREYGECSAQTHYVYPRCKITIEILGEKLDESMLNPSTKPTL